LCGIRPLTSRSTRKSSQPHAAGVLAAGDGDEHPLACRRVTSSRPADQRARPVDMDGLPTARIMETRK
jgi:hypothetical protein